jgi:hypothetical protein
MALALRHRFIIAGLTGLSGGLYMLSMSDMISPHNSDLAQPGLAAFGALIAGFVTARLFGCSDGRGWVIAALGYVAATSLGAVFAGWMISLPELFPITTLLPLLEWLGFALFLILLAPLFVFAMMFEKPVLVLIWFGSLALIHLTARWLRGPVVNP